MTQEEVPEGLFEGKSQYFKIFCVFYKGVKRECLYSWKPLRALGHCVLHL